MLHQGKSSHKNWQDHPRPSGSRVVRSNDWVRNKVVKDREERKTRTHKTKAPRHNPPKKRAKIQSAAMFSFLVGVLGGVGDVGHVEMISTPPASHSCSLAGESRGNKLRLRGVWISSPIVFNMGRSCATRTPPIRTVVPRAQLQDFIFSNLNLSHACSFAGESRSSKLQLKKTCGSVLPRVQKAFVLLLYVQEPLDQTLLQHATGRTESTFFGSIFSSQCLGSVFKALPKGIKA